MTWLLARGMCSARLLLVVCLTVVPELQHTVAVGGTSGSVGGTVSVPRDVSAIARGLAHVVF
jgi:hypothetical protein